MIPIMQLNHLYLLVLASMALAQVMNIIAALMATPSTSKITSYIQRFPEHFNQLPTATDIMVAAPSHEAIHYHRMMSRRVVKMQDRIMIFSTWSLYQPPPSLYVLVRVHSELARIDYESIRGVSFANVIPPTAVVANLSSAVGALANISLLEALDTAKDVILLVFTNAAFGGIGSTLRDMTLEQITTILKHRFINNQHQLR
ncbi:MAG: hypothetical protein M1817_004388 [Caeruleum heppii]|nr:MAG: hypothetical protein M1817_004388 [Caeruleum heppii]